MGSCVSSQEEDSGVEKVDKPAPAPPNPPAPISKGNEEKEEKRSLLPQTARAEKETTVIKVAAEVLVGRPVSKQITTREKEKALREEHKRKEGDLQTARAEKETPISKRQDQGANPPLVVPLPAVLNQTATKAKEEKVVEEDHKWKDGWKERQKKRDEERAKKEHQQEDEKLAKAVTTRPKEVKDDPAVSSSSSIEVKQSDQTGVSQQQQQQQLVAKTVGKTVGNPGAALKEEQTQDNKLPSAPPPTGESNHLRLISDPFSDVSTGSVLRLNSCQSEDDRLNFDDGTVEETGSVRRTDSNAFPGVSPSSVNLGSGAIVPLSASGQHGIMFGSNNGTAGVERGAPAREGKGRSDSDDSILRELLSRDTQHTGGAAGGGAAAATAVAGGDSGGGVSGPPSGKPESHKEDVVGVGIAAGPVIRSDSNDSILEELLSRDTRQAHSGGDDTAAGGGVGGGGGASGESSSASGKAGLPIKGQVEVGGVGGPIARSDSDDSILRDLLSKETRNSAAARASNASGGSSSRSRAGGGGGGGGGLGGVSGSRPAPLMDLYRDDAGGGGGGDRDSDTGSVIRTPSFQYDLEASGDLPEEDTGSVIRTTSYQQEEEIDLLGSTGGSSAADGMNDTASVVRLGSSRRGIQGTREANEEEEEEEDTGSLVRTSSYHKYFGSSNTLNEGENDTHTDSFHPYLPDSPQNKGLPPLPLPPAKMQLNGTKGEKEGARRNVTDEVILPADVKKADRQIVGKEPAAAPPPPPAKQVADDTAVAVVKEVVGEPYEEEEADETIAILCAGNFWCTEAVYHNVKGIEKLESGYCGGKKSSASFAAVSADGTGHCLAVKMKFNPAVMSYDDILDVFFDMHDPTKLEEKQHLRSTIFYLTPRQKESAEKAIRKHQQQTYEDRIQTAVIKASKFFSAEGYRQDYYRKHRTEGYCKRVIDPIMKNMTHPCFSASGW